MNLGALIALFRQETDDQAAPYLWSDAEVTDFYNDAQNEACRRARLLVDSTTSAICNFNVTIAGSVITLDPRVIIVKRVKLASRSVPLQPRLLADMDSEQPGWESLTGPVTHYIPNLSTGKLRLFRIPTAVDTGTLTVVRLPLADMADLNADSPEISPSYHRSLRYWALYRGYSKRDAETYDPKRAGDALAMFEQEFGHKSPAYDEEWIREQYGVLDADGSY